MSTIYITLVSRIGHLCRFGTITAVQAWSSLSDIAAVMTCSVASRDQWISGM